jgi:ankyrin repeat protein
MQTNRAGETPLHLTTSYHGSEEVALLLLNAGTKVSELKDPGKILLGAAARGWTRFVQQFSDAGFSVYEANEQGETILHLAATAGSVSLTQWALDAGANISSATVGGETALHRAAMHSSESVTRLLLSAKANVRATNVDGESPLHYAASAGSDEVTRLLLDAGADVNATSIKGDTALHRASARWWSETSYTLSLAGLAMFATAGKQVPVDFTACDRYSAVIRRLVGATVDVSAANVDGDTALHLVLGREERKFRDIHSPSAPLWCINGAEERMKAVTQQFLDAGADIYALSKHGETVLHLAALGGWSGAMQLLINAGADVTVTTRNGETILHYALLSESESALGLLSDYGVDVSATAKNGRTPPDRVEASGWESVTQTLLSNNPEL